MGGIKFPGMTDVLPETANVKYVDKNSNEGTVLTIKKGVNTVWQRQEQSFNIVITDAGDRIYKMSEVKKLIEILSITITRNGNVVYNKNLSGDLFGNDNYNFCNIECGILQNDKIYIRVVGKDWIGIRYAIIINTSNSNKSQTLFNNYGYSITKETTISEQTISESAIAATGDYSLEICLSKLDKLSQMNTGILQWSISNGWELNDRSYVYANNKLKSTGQVNKIKFRLHCEQGSSADTQVITATYNEDGFSASTSGIFHNASSEWLYYSCLVAPADNFIDWDAVNVYGDFGRCLKGAYSKKINGGYYDYLHWGDSYNGNEASNPTQQT